MGTPSFALAPVPCPGKPSAQGNRVPMGQLSESPIATGLRTFKLGLKPQWHDQQDTQSADAHGQKEA